MMEIHSEDEANRFNRGLAIRTAVLGEQHVRRSLDNADAFDEPMQRFVTEVGWGEIWARQTLDRKTQSMITVSMLVALGRRDELGVHIRGALNNGVTPSELQAILLHSALYCGAPAALEAFRVAKQCMSAGAAPEVG